MGQTNQKSQAVSGQLDSTMKDAGTALSGMKLGHPSLGGTCPGASGRTPPWVFSGCPAGSTCPTPQSPQTLRVAGVAVSRAACREQIPAEPFLKVTRKASCWLPWGSVLASEG